MGEDSKFGFSERTSVDKGATNEAPPVPPTPEPEENLEATAAISLADIGKIDLGAPAPPAADIPDLDDVEKTGAMSLDALRSAGLLDDDDKIKPKAPKAPKVEEEDIPPEATAMLSAPIQDYLPKADAPSAPSGFDDEPQATMMLQSPLDGGPPPPAAAPEPPPEEPAKAQIQAGNDRGRTFDLTQDEYLVGRGLNCDIVLNDASVSRKHFKFRRVDGQWQLHDLGSGNGTKVNGVRVDVVDLFHGSVIDAGTTSVLWDHPGHEPPVAAPAPVAAAAVDEDEPEATMALSAMDPSMLPPGAGQGNAGFKDFGGAQDRDDATRVGDMASLEVLNDWDPKQAVADAQAAEGIAPAGPPKRGKKKKKGKGLLIVALLLLLVGGFLLTDRFAQLGIVFPVAAEVPVADSDDGGGDEAGAGDEESGETEEQQEAAKLMGEGLAAFKEKKWLQARKAFKKALKLDPEVKGGKAGLEQAQAELAAQRDLENADKALEEESFQEALTLAKKVADTSSYYADAQKVQKSAVDGLVGKALTKARELEEAKDLAAAAKVVETALALAPDDPELLGLKGDLKIALESDTADADPDADQDAVDDAEMDVEEEVVADVGPEAAEEVEQDVAPDVAPEVVADTGPDAPAVAAADAATAVAAVMVDATDTADVPTDADADASDADVGPETAPVVAVAKPVAKPSTNTGSSSRRKPSKPRASSGGTAKKISGALASYSSGNFGGAVSALKAVAGSRAKKKDRAKAARLAKNIDKFKTVYQTGMSAAKGFKAGTAISNLSKARKLDSGISGAYQGKIKKSLAKMYAYRANAAHSSGNLGVAGSNARKALAFDPSLSAAKRIYTEVQAKAQGWFDSAKASAKSNPDKAISLLQKVIKVLPRTDARYKSAYALLNKLAEEE